MASFFLIFKLISRQLFLFPGRTVAAVLGIMTSTCAVIWVVSAYDGLVSQFEENAGKYLGRYDLLIVPKTAAGKTSFVNEDFIERLRDDPGVLELCPVNQSRVSITKVHQKTDQKQEPSVLQLVLGSNPPVFGAPPIEPILVGTPANSEPYELISGRWLLADSADRSIVLTSGAAKNLKVSVGDSVNVTTFANQVKLKVIGIIKQPPIAPILGTRNKRNSDPQKKTSRSKTSLKESRVANAKTKLGVPTPWVEGSAINAAFVRPSLSAKINGFPFQPTLLKVTLRDTVNISQFSEVWEKRLSESVPALEIIHFERVKNGFRNTRTLSTRKSEAYIAASMACLAAVFIIFSLLSMGVSERSREIAVLRTVALSRQQVLAIIVGESIFLGTTGWLSGFLSSILLFQVGEWWFPSLNLEATSVGWTCAILTFAAVLIGCLLASIFPGWNATRITPLDAVSQSSFKTPSRTFYLWSSISGLTLLITATAMVFFLELSPSWHLWLYSFITYPSLIIGMALLTPIAIRWSQHLICPVLALIFRLSPNLLLRQMIQNQWRMMGATVSLAVGLGLFVSTHVWGYSMLEPFVPSRWLPDMLVSFQPNGLDQEGIRLVGKVEGVRTGGVMPLAIEQAKFDWGAKGKPELVNYDNAVIFGIDPKLSFRKASPFLKLNFIEGDPESVAKKLSNSDSCIISQSFSRSTGYRIGDWLSFIPPGAKTSSSKVRYQIAGIVALPGWQWITKFSGVRRHYVRTACMVFAGRDSVQRNFHLNRPEFCWVNLKENSDEKLVSASMQSIAERKSGGTFVTTEGRTIESYRPFARATSTKTVKKAITMMADSTIWTMSLIPLLTLIIMSTAIIQVIVSSVRARTWEFGVLQSIGVSRWQLIRLIVAETLVIGFSACFLSLGFGVLAGWCGVEIASYGRWGAFIGNPVFLVPWWPISIGFLIAIGLCLIAAILPTWKIGRCEPLSLLSNGRVAR